MKHLLALSFLILFFIQSKGQDVACGYTADEVICQDFMQIALFDYPWQSNCNGGFGCSYTISVAKNLGNDVIVIREECVGEIEFSYYWRIYTCEGILLEECSIGVTGSCNIGETIYDALTNQQVIYDCTTQELPDCSSINNTPGCIDPEANNYNPDANEDDGSCAYCCDGVQNGTETGLDCGGPVCAPCAYVLDCNVNAATISVTSIPFFISIEDILGVKGACNISFDKDVSVDTYKVDCSDFGGLNFKQDSILLFDIVSEDSCYVTYNITKSSNLCTCANEDYNALMDFYHETDGDNWRFNSGWVSGALGIGCDPCDWYGIVCNGNDRVIAINLDTNLMDGIIPSTINEIDDLILLDLNGNSLKGSIPEEIGQLNNLEFLILYENQLEGIIPSSIGNLTELQRIVLFSNQLEGSIPSNLTNLDNLEWLLLANNQLSGSIPNNLNQLSSLSIIWLMENNLTGSIPSQISGVTNLEELVLYDNNLTGEIPSDIGALSNISKIMLNNNNLEGCFPASLDNFCSLGVTQSLSDPGYNFSGNPLLPYSGDFALICGGNDQVDAPCGVMQDSIIDMNCDCISNEPLKPFITTWKTDNPGTSCVRCIDIPTFPGEIYNYDIDWDNDGVFDEFGVTGDASYNFGIPGTYKVAIRGDFPRIYFNDQGDKDKIINIDQWGDIEWKSMSNAFAGCDKLNSNATDVPNLSSVLTLERMFWSARDFNGDISNWDVSSVTNMSEMFRWAFDFNSDISNWNVSNVNSMRFMFSSAQSFNHNLGYWDISSVNNMSGMLGLSGLDCNNYSSTLIGWASNSSTPNDITISVSDLEYSSDAISARNQLISKGWNIDGDMLGNCNVSTECAETIDEILCLDWLNQIITTTNFCLDPGSSAFKFKVYTTEHNGAPAILVDSYSNCINPTVFGAGFTLYECNGFQIESCTYLGFENCNDPPLDNPIIGPAYTAATLIYDSDVDNLPNCNTQTAFITTWKTDNPGSSCSSCITIPTFPGETYNYDVDWDNDGTYDEIGVTGDVTHIYPSSGTYKVSIRGIFPRIYFNNTGDADKIINIDQWGEIVWTSMEGAFRGCANLNLDASDNPDLSNVTSLRLMFSGAETFNGNIENWDVSTITDMSSMFWGATLFNQPLEAWNMNNVIDMSSMFLNATSFNQPVGAWNVSNVTNMNSLFSEASSFDQPIGSWNVGQVTSMRQLFDGAENFNQPLMNWNVSKVLDMVAMFREARSFNRPIGNWNTENVTNTSNMFTEAEAFNQPIGNWNMSNVESITSMFRGASSFNQSIENWDVSNVTSILGMLSVFFEATSFNQPLEDWDVSNVVYMAGMFNGASAFNQPLGNWEIESVTELDNMLNDSGIDCDNYSATLLGWAANSNTSNNLTLGASGLEYGSNALSARDQLIAKGWTINGDSQGSCGIIEPCSSDIDSILCYDWLNQIITNTDFCLDPGSSAFKFKVYTTEHNGAPAILVDSYSNCINPTVFGAGFTLYECNGFQIESCTYLGFENCNNPPLDNPIIGPAYSAATLIYDSDVDNLPNCNAQTPFITTWKTDNPGLVCSSCVTIPTFSGETYNYDVDWDNDGTFDEFGITGDVTHDYGSVGTYTFAIQGQFPRIYFNNTGDHEKIIRIDQWGNNAWTSMNSAFDGCNNLTSTAPDIPDLSNVTDMTEMFNRASSFNHDIGGWDVSQVTSMRSMFSFASTFNQDLNNWDVSNVTDMYSMFFAAPEFNGDITSWDVSSVSDMIAMFDGAVSFNQDIGGWNVGNVTDMSSMFDGADSFNQDLNNWNVSNVTDMGNMFFGAINFNGNISNWNVSNVNDMRAMFGFASSFNQDISNWNVSNVTDMRQMFDRASNFNSELQNWDVSSVTDMVNMFKGTIFNQDIGNWNVANVSTMSSMFEETTLFNQDIGGWDVSNVNSFGQMFFNATNFNQDLGNWEFKSTASFTANGNGFLQNAGLSCENYSKSLIGWANNPNTPDDRNLGPLTGMEYGADAVSARNQLISKGWTIDGDVQGSCSTTTACEETSDEILCLDWLNQIITNTTGCMDPGSSAFRYRVYTTEHNGSPAILVDSYVNCINPTLFGAGYTLYECNGFQIESCTYLGFETCSDPPVDNPIIGPAYSIAALIYDSDVDNLPNCTSGRPFITTWQTDNNGESCNSCITIPTFPGETYDYNIDIGNDGTYEITGVTGDYTYDFGTPGTYEIAISGTFPRIYFSNGGDDEKLVNIGQWGDIEWTSMNSAFMGCSNVNSNSTDAPDLSLVTDMYSMFRFASTFNHDIGDWDVSNVVDMERVFTGAIAFNQDLSTWNVANVTVMESMFSFTDVFNQDLSAWNVSNVTNMRHMFWFAEAFNQDLSLWNVENLENAHEMFHNAIAYDQSLGDWSLNSVNDLESMLDNTGLGCQNYTTTLQGWAGNSIISTGQFFGASGIEYGNEAKAARDSLITIFGWTITGDVDLGTDCVDCGPNTCQVLNPPSWLNTQTIPDITVSCASDVPILLFLDYTNNQSGDCLIEGQRLPTRDESNFDGCSGTIVETWNYTTDCGIDITPYSRTITVSSQGSLVFDATPTAQAAVSCDDIDLYEISLDYMLDQGGDCIPAGVVSPVRIDNYDACGGTVTLSWMVDEPCYDLLEFTQTLTIEANDGFQFSDLPKDITIDCDALPFVPDRLNVGNGIEGNCAFSEEVLAVSAPLTQDCPGTITNTWTFIDPCSNSPLSHTQIITLLDCAPPSLEDDYLEIRAGNLYSLNLFDNDFVPDSFSTRIVNIEREDIFLTNLFTTDGTFEFSIEESFFDTIRVEYEICNLKCDNCSTEIFRIVDEALKDIFLTDIITPDGDGMNDELKFNFESEVKGLKLTVFNRWGSVVFEELDYKNDWKADGLPGGIYYYVLTLGVSEIRKTLTIVK